MARLYLRLAGKLRQVGREVSVRAKAAMRSGTVPLTNRIFSVPANLKSQKLANEILKQAGLPNRSERPPHR